MSGHTPGPWGLPDAGVNCGSVLVSAGSCTKGWRGMVASVDAGNYAASQKEGLANARLIADAPETAAERDRLLAEKAELLAELKDLFAMVQGEVPSLLEDHHSYPKIVAAIKSAEASHG